MTIRSINTDSACATTFARLDDSPIVAHTDDNTLLLNMPRRLDEIAEVAEATPKKGFFARLFGR